MLSMTLRVLDHDVKRVHLFHEMFLAASDGDKRGDDLIATAEQMLVHVDSRAARSAPMPPELVLRLEAIHRAHAGLARPEVVGKPMRINRSQE